MTSRNGSAEWKGDLKGGSGTITVGNGLFTGPFTYDSRFGEQGGTNPEQMIAAAQAGCFTMALASLLSKAGHAPDRLHTNARVELRIADGKPSLTRLDIETEGQVPGISEDQFRSLAEEAKRTCPVARALSGIPEIVLTAKLAVTA
jgi:lipoyl-dependent peroxiredoxin